MAKVSLQHVSKTYRGAKGGEVAAVQDLNLEVADREFVVLVGPSGSGKTTTLRMIAGLEEICGGDLFIGEKRVNDLAPKDRDIAMVFQNYALYPHLSVFQNLAFGLKLRRFSDSEIKKRVLDAARILEIEDCLERRPLTLSGGQRQRVAVGRAMVRQPKVFLFDEPLSNLDATMRAQMRTEITKLHQRLQATMIYVTHDQVEAMTMADRIVVMRDGIVQQIDAPLSLYQKPANLFVAGFLGSPPMNFIHGKLKDAPDGVVFKENDGGVIECKITDQPAARAFAGKEVVLGLRPESIVAVRTDGRRDDGSFQALVDVVEPTGAETNIHFHTGAHALICRSLEAISHDDAGHRMRFVLDPARAHLFDPATTRRIE
ncbi:MAG: multiple sugar transport system ATP-binding protein [Chthoniobacter sp.]|nr:multiple sugar transport system ATP-binding protein [Chthoniobacter sp.]